MKWFCSVCGYVYEGEQEPECCPSCNERKFIRPTYAFPAKPAPVAVQEQALATPQMAAYLDHLYRVETGIYEQAALKEKLQEYLEATEDSPSDWSARENRKKMLDVPVVHEAKNEVRNCQKKLEDLEKCKPKEPVIGVPVPDYGAGRGLNCGDYGCFVFIAFGLFGIMTGSSLDIAFNLWVGIAFLIIFGGIEALIIAARIEARKICGQQEAAYYQAKKQHDVDMKAYQAELGAHNSKVWAARREVEEALQKQSEVEAEVLANNRRFIQSNLAALDASLSDLQATQEQLYARNIIFPKYRTLPCVSTMLEYMQAGRVTELTGPNGAYNLYEAELRQNLIIAHVESIASEIETIRKNQYNLYQSVEQTNRTLANVADQMKEQISVQNNMLEVGRDMLKLTAVSTSCAMASAKNTEAIKFLSLLK